MLPGDAEFLKEIQSYLKIEGFLRKNTSTQLAKYETIKEAKRVRCVSAMPTQSSI